VNSRQARRTIISRQGVLRRVFAFPISCMRDVIGRTSAPKPGSSFEHDLFGKPVPSFHALATGYVV
jgi:hypothetical protein